jgi:hypothetical protein
VTYAVTAFRMSVVNATGTVFCAVGARSSPSAERAISLVAYALRSLAGSREQRLTGEK